MYVICHSVTAGAIRKKPGVGSPHIRWHVLGYLDPGNTSPGGTPLTEGERGYYCKYYSSYWDLRLTLCYISRVSYPAFCNLEIVTIHFCLRAIDIVTPSGIRSTKCRGANFNWMRVWRFYTLSHHGWTFLNLIFIWIKSFRCLFVWNFFEKYIHNILLKLNFKITIRIFKLVEYDGYQIERYNKS